MRKIIVFLPLFSLLFAGCDKETTKKATQQAQQTMDDLHEQGKKLLNPNDKDKEEPKGALEADKVINRRVFEAIYNDSSLSKELDTIQISTQDGVVTLKGSVSSKDIMDKIVEKVKSVKGVKEVNNQLSIASKENDDDDDYSLRFRYNSKSPSSDNDENKS